jgi:tRNA(fMet)-specific endonuclease VapC
MILLDTDHLSVLRGDPSERQARLNARLDAVVGEEVGTTVITLEEQMRGWLATIAKERQTVRLIRPYDELAALVEFFADWLVVRFDRPAAALFDTYNRIRISASDRKIAAVTVARDALLLTANRRDFEQIPGLRFANSLD